MSTPVIVGAGLAGLLAAHAWPQCPILEASPSPGPSHQALLRFRTDNVAKLTGIEFKSVQVRKGICSGGRFVEPTIALANAYSLKVLNRLLPDRSIWNLQPAQRFIAPDNFYDMLIEAVGSRVHWNAPVDFRQKVPDCALINTAPLPLVLDQLGVAPDLDFVRAPITVRRMSIKNCELYQTVYFPDPATTMYRASITGSTLIAEFAGDPTDGWLNDVASAFWLPFGALDDMTEHKQRFGKIAPIDDAARKALLFRLTTQHSIFSLGRFATWRNILLDDVVDDIAVVKRLLRGHSYDHMKAIL